jgi:hypothetical protein
MKHGLEPGLEGRGTVPPDGPAPDVAGQKNPQAAVGGVLGRGNFGWDDPLLSSPWGGAP